MEAVGFRAALVAFASVFAYDFVQVFQALGIFSVHPWDAVAIYATSLAITIPFALAFLALHYLTAEDRRFWSHAAVLFATMYAVFGTFNYVEQLTVTIPFAGSSPIMNQAPHTLFWSVDALAYLLLALATLFAVPLFRKVGPERWTRRFFLANALDAPLTAVVYFYPVFSFTILLFAIPWLVTASGSAFFLMWYFRARLALAERGSVQVAKAPEVAARVA